MRDSIKVFLIIAVVLTVAFLVLSYMTSMWLSGLDGDMPEKLQFVYGYATMDEDGIFNIILSVKNIGSKHATIDRLMLNGHILSYWHDFISQNITGSKVRIGERVDGTITLRKGSEWTSGMFVNMRIFTVAGKECSKTIVLP